MKGYIKRLLQDIEKTELKRDCIANFLTYRHKEVNDKQAELLNKQFDIMNQLLDVMKLRLANEQEIHPDYFEDLPEVDDADDCDDSEEITEE